MQSFDGILVDTGNVVFVVGAAVAIGCVVVGTCTVGLVVGIVVTEECIFGVTGGVVVGVVVMEDCVFVDTRDVELVIGAAVALDRIFVDASDVGLVVEDVPLFWITTPLNP